MEGIRSPQIGDLADSPESRIWPISEWPTIVPERPTNIAFWLEYSSARDLRRAASDHLSGDEPFFITSVKITSPQHDLSQTGSYEETARWIEVDRRTVKTGLDRLL